MSFPSKIFRWLGYFIFWFWNISFLILVTFGIIPLIGADIVNGFFYEDLPIDFLIGLTIVVLVPIAMIAIGVAKIRSQPQSLIRYFYGVEAPIFILCLIRLTLLRELTFASAFLIASVLMAAGCYFFFLWSAANVKEMRAPKICLSASALMLAIAGYIGAILAIYALPAAYELYVDIGYMHFSFKQAADLLTSAPLLFLALLLLILSLALFVWAPVFLIVFYGQAYKTIWGHARENVSWRAAAAIVALTATAWAGVFWAADRQPQTEVFALLKQPAVTQQQKKRIVDDSEQVRRGLLNAYLYRYRYLAAAKQLDGVSRLYKSIFGLPANLAQIIQTSHDFLISPVLYHGGEIDDRVADKLYSQIYGAPIQKRESAAIRNAMNATAWRQGVAASLLAIDQKKVWLAEQHIDVVKNDASADVELYEVYENTTKDRQEIFYYFSLPENAAITGLWLGESADRDKRSAYVVAPRGAAQKVYANQLQRTIDPALLEQVGPRQYRLRAYPIPPKTFAPKTSAPKTFAAGPAQRMHLWLTYSVLGGENGVFPELLEKRNVFWTEETKRFLNGKEKEYAAADRWTPADDPQNTTLPHPSSVVVGDYLVSAEPLPTADEKQHAGKIAILIDSSYGMANQRTRLLSSLAEFRRREPAVQTDVFIQPVSEDLKKIDPPQDALANFVFFGFLSDPALWNQAAAIEKLDNYQAVFILTDRDGYELSANKPILAESARPVWFVHLGALAPAYEDSLASAISHGGGGVALTLEAAWRDFLARSDRPPFERVHGQTLWRFSPAPSKDQASANQPLANQPLANQPLADKTLAAKMLIDYLSTASSAPDLDALHAIARENAVVTPYSSMLVLVSEAQRNELKNAEQQQERFNRTVETGVENLPRPGTPLVSGAPEPETWILLTISLLGIVILKKKGMLRRKGAF